VLFQFSRLQTLHWALQESPALSSYHIVTCPGFCD
jgi:hypothetical protein